MTHSPWTAIAGMLLMALSTINASAADKVVAAHYAPLMIQGEAERPGYAIEVLEEAARRAGRDVEITFLPYQRAMFTVKTDSATLMPALFRGKQRDEDFLWVAQIQQANLRFAVTDGEVVTLEDARARSAIVVEKGTTADVLLTGHGFKNVVRVSTPEASARMLESGRAEAWFQDDRLMQRTWDQLGIPGKLQLGDYTHRVPIYLVASPGLSNDVTDAYRNAIAAMRDDGTLDRLWESYQLFGG